MVNYGFGVDSFIVNLSPYLVHLDRFAAFATSRSLHSNLKRIRAMSDMNSY